MFFDREGFCLVRQVLTPSDVSSLRAKLDCYWAETRGKNPEHYSPRSLLTQEVLQMPEFFLIPFRSKIVEALKSVLGKNYSLLPDLEVQRNQFASHGWHFDAGSEREK